MAPHNRHCVQHCAACKGKDPNNFPNYRNQQAKLAREKEAERAREEAKIAREEAKLARALGKTMNV